MDADDAPELPEARLPIRRHRLANGLAVVLQPDTTLPLVTVNLWYHVGSKNERPGRTGFAHLFEHMLFQGSEHVPDTDHFRYIQQAGGVANGSTWYDRTNYYETLPSQHLDLGLWLESDRMGFFLPALTSEKLENQRDVVMNERRERVDNQPYGRCREVLQALLYPEGHPYRWPVIGHMEDIAAATLEEIEEFFRTWYHPGNAVLTLTGDFEADDALERVERWFGDLESGPEPPPVTVPDPRFTGVRREVVPDDVRVPRLYLGFHGPPYGDDEWYAGAVTAHVLADGKGSLLHRDLVYERELARSLGASLPETEVGASFSIVATGNVDTDPDELEGEILAHVEALAADGPTDEDLARVKNRLVTDLAQTLQTLDNRADALSQHTTYFDHPEGAFGEVERTAAVDAEAVRRFARERLAEAGRAVVVAVPKGASAP